MKTKKDCFCMIQKVVMERDMFCRYPGCTKRSSAGHHIFRRNNNSTAFNPQYVIGLCLEHHSWAHGQPDEFLSWVIGWMGESEYYDALRTSHSIVKHQDINEIHRLLSIELYRLK